MHIPIHFPLAAALLLAGCSVSASRVQQQIGESEARTAVAQAQLEERMLSRIARTDQAVAAASEQLRHEIEAQAEAQRRLVVDVVARQRDTLVAQVRAMDETISTLTTPRPSPTAMRTMP